MDWGDACISHPFFTLSVTLEGVLAWGLDDEEDSEDTAPYRDAYLKPFAERYDGDLVAAATLATRLGWACRAVNGHVPGRQQADEHPAADVPRRAAVGGQPGGVPRMTPTVSRWSEVREDVGGADPEPGSTPPRRAPTGSRW